MPPPSPAELPLIVLLVIVSVAPPLVVGDAAAGGAGRVAADSAVGNRQRRVAFEVAVADAAAADVGAELPLIVLLVTVSVASPPSARLAMPPPQRPSCR